MRDKFLCHMQIKLNGSLEGSMDVRHSLSRTWFYVIKKIQKKQVTDKCNLTLVKCKTKGKTFTANDVKKNPELNKEREGSSKYKKDWLMHNTTIAVKKDKNRNVRIICYNHLLIFLSLSPLLVTMFTRKRKC